MTGTLLAGLALAAPLTDSEVLAVVDAHAGLNLGDLGDLCVARPASHPEVTVVAQRVYDVGCVPWLWIVHGQVHERADDATRVVFGPTCARGEDAFLAWVLDGLLPFARVEVSVRAPEGFRGGAYHPPRVKRKRSVLRVDAWSRHPIGLRDEPGPVWSRVRVEHVCSTAEERDASTRGGSAP